MLYYSMVDQFIAIERERERLGPFIAIYNLKSLVTSHLAPDVPFLSKR